MSQCDAVSHSSESCLITLLTDPRGWFVEAGLIALRAVPARNPGAFQESSDSGAGWGGSQSEHMVSNPLSAARRAPGTRIQPHQMVDASLSVVEPFQLTTAAALSGPDQSDHTLTEP